MYSYIRNRFIEYLNSFVKGRRETGRENVNKIDYLEL